MWIHFGDAPRVLSRDFQSENLGLDFIGSLIYWLYLPIALVKHCFVHLVFFKVKI
jgi:hypothetical protein